MWRFLGIVTGALSLAYLAWKGFDIGFGPTALLVLEYYETLVGALLGWSEPYTQKLVDIIAAQFNIDIEIREHWRHVFILMALYVSACARSTWAAYEGSKMVSVTVGLLGYAIAIVASIASGVISTTAGPSGLLLAVFPISGVVLFELILTSINREYFKNESLKIAVIGFASLALAFLLNSQLLSEQRASLGLAALGLFTFLLAIYWILYGAVEAKGSGQGWRAYFMNCAPAKLGFMMLSSITGAAGFILANAGLGSFGL